MFKFLDFIFTGIVILLIKVYQLIISPFFNFHCRYLPTCSEYAIIAFKSHGFFYGFYYSLKRVTSCHPFGRQGYDPVPKKINKDSTNG